MKRKVYDQLLKWKQERHRESAALVNGARRVGKSYIVKEFAQKEYKSYILLDFNKVGKDVKDLFDNHLDDLDTFFMYPTGTDIQRHAIQHPHLPCCRNVVGYGCCCRITFCF